MRAAKAAGAHTADRLIALQLPTTLLHYGTVYCTTFC
jgi:hypothetical protein